MSEAKQGKRPAKITPAIDKLLEREARKRAECMTAKQISDQTGLAKSYVAQRLSYLRRKIEIEIAPRETSTS